MDGEAHSAHFLVSAVRLSCRLPFPAWQFTMFFSKILPTNPSFCLNYLFKKKSL